MSFCLARVVFTDTSSGLKAHNSTKRTLSVVSGFSLSVLTDVFLKE